MDFRFRVASAACAFVLVLGVVSAFAVDGDDQDVAADDRQRSLDEDEPLEANDSTTTTTAPDGEPGSGNDGSTTTEPDSSTSTSAAPQQTMTSAAPVTTLPLGVTPTTPGEYIYDISGTVDGNPVSGTSKMTIPAADENGRQPQTQSGPEGSSTTTYRFTSEGTYLESMTMTSPAGELTFAATQPFLVIPTGASASAKAEGQLRGSGLASGINVHVRFTLRDVGADTSTAEIEATITGSVAGCDVDGEMDSTIVARTSDQLPIENQSHTDVSISGLLCPGNMTSETTSVLRN